MILVFTMAATLWGIGAAMRAPKQQRYIMLGVLFAAVIAVQLSFPIGHPLKENTGGSFGLWALIGGFVALILLYRAGLNHLKSLKPKPDEPAQSNATFKPVELDRYARHIILPDIGGNGQKALKNARVLVIGAGGLGSPVLTYLAASGVGTIGIMDDDVVEASNLQRQIIHGDPDIGRAKVQSAADALYRLNPFVNVQTFERRFSADIATDMVAQFDMVIDGSDNFETRQAVNTACVAAQKPLVFGALGPWEGMTGLYDGTVTSPCFSCVFPTPPADREATSCAEAGVFAPLPGVIGTLMAAECVKLITKSGTSLSGRVLIYDARDAVTRTMTVKKHPDCPNCKGAP